MLDGFDIQPDITKNSNLTPVLGMGILSSEMPPATVPKPASCLKLVASTEPSTFQKRSMMQNPIISEPIYKNESSQYSSFTAEIRKRSPYDFVMVAHDSFHYLNCELPLTFKENQEKGKRSFLLVCQFPIIYDEGLIDFIEEDEDLLGIIMIQFQMQILKNLFAFCAAQNVENLIISATEEQFEGLGIYQGFVNYVDKIPTKKGIFVEMAISIQPNLLVECNEFMDDMMMQFRKTLWKEQKINPTIRNYLKTNVRLSTIPPTNEYGHCSISAQ